jgi:hypothetical protein
MFLTLKGRTIITSNNDVAIINMVSSHVAYITMDDSASIIGANAVIEASSAGQVYITMKTSNVVLDSGTLQDDSS